MVLRFYYGRMKRERKRRKQGRAYENYYNGVNFSDGCTTAAARFH